MKLTKFVRCRWYYRSVKKIRCWSVKNGPLNLCETWTTVTLFTILDGVCLYLNFAQFDNHLIISTPRMFYSYFLRKKVVRSYQQWHIFWADFISSLARSLKCCTLYTKKSSTSIHSILKMNNWHKLKVRSIPLWLFNFVLIITMI